MLCILLVINDLWMVYQFGGGAYPFQIFESRASVSQKIFQKIENYFY